ncbi:MAG: STAS domain-containing protein [Prevotellaceae bacterium]|jgi:anti-anti-sigma factor|nr:STAS domain-containing protein [Prevotellaceae bacterium]
MEVTILNGDQTIIKVSGRLDTVNAPLFGEKIAPVTESMKDVVVDCNELEYVASSGLRQLLTLQKMANQKKAKLVFRSVKPDIKNIFDMTGFASMFNLED